MKMHFDKVTVLLFASCFLLFTNLHYATSHDVELITSEVYIGKIISDWNSKYQGSNLVAVIDIGIQSEAKTNVLVNIPKENTVIVMSPEMCQSMSHGKAEFIIIVSDLYDTVS
jgi:hypothetical protein